MLNYNMASSVSLSPSTMDLLSTLAFPPSECDVVCGRGKGSYNRPGNKIFRAIVCKHIPEYMAAKTKLDKGVALNRIMEDIRSQNNGTSRFLKPGKNGSWYELSDDQAREKVGHTMREAISALDGAAEKEATKKVFAKKQNALLAQQRAIFKYLLVQSTGISQQDRLIPSPDGINATSPY
jgi:hypothetical protein